MSSDLNFIAPMENYSVGKTWMAIQESVKEAGEFLIMVSEAYFGDELIHVNFNLSEVDESFYLDFDSDYRNYPGAVAGIPIPGYNGLGHINGLNDNVFNAFYIRPFSEEDWTVLYRFAYAFFITNSDWFLWYGFNEWAYDAPYILRQQACNDPKWVFKPPRSSFENNTDAENF